MSDDVLPQLARWLKEMKPGQHNRLAELIAHHMKVREDAAKAAGQVGMNARCNAEAEKRIVQAYRDGRHDGAKLMSEKVKLHKGWQKSHSPDPHDNWWHKGYRAAQYDLEEKINAAMDEIDGTS